MVIIVKSPLQIICAVEYLYAQGIELTDAQFIYLRKYDLADVQVMQTFSYFGIANAQTIRFGNANVMNFFGRKILLSKYKPLKAAAKAIQLVKDYFSEKKLASFLEDPATIVLGDPNFKLYKKLILQTSRKEIVLLDDGLGSMEISVDYAQNNNKVVSFSFLRTGKEIPNAGVVLENHFSKLRSAFPPSNMETVLFIGQPLYEAKLVSISEMNQLFREVSEHFNDKRIIYIPHRWEFNLQKMEFPSNFKLTTLQDLPLELFISTMDELPQQMVSFYSSALITLRKILPDAVGFTAFDIQSLVKLDIIRKAYEKIASFDIEVRQPSKLIKTGTV